MASANQLKARFDLSPPKDSEDFMRTLARTDPLCNITLLPDGATIQVDFNDGSTLICQANGDFVAKQETLQ